MTFVLGDGDNLARNREERIEQVPVDLDAEHSGNKLGLGQELCSDSQLLGSCSGHNVKQIIII